MAIVMQNIKDMILHASPQALGCVSGYYHRRHGGVTLTQKRVNDEGICVVRALMVENSSDNSSNFLKRMEQAWLISQV
ncbi:hypothetical protein L2E82_25442 [Cichorium intybus]|uniref:Uncharacterized protein n=1 Tax=Cichorium intybus TaxID=13427 RepID=A0ACB9E3H1_CICIN|nr:hypothetical protein L2E82_25442 [Cichorium intybus]